MTNLPDPDELRADLAKRVDDIGLPAASVAFRIGEDVTEAAAGILNVRTGVEATTGSLFQIGSTTKVYTATLVMALVGEGKVGLDDRIESVLEGVQFGADPAARDVTVRHLLAHTSGVHGDHFDEYGRGDMVLERMTAQLGNLAQIHPVGAMMSYCNSGYSVLGRLVEVLTDMPFHQAMTERLLRPMGATHSAATPEEAIVFRTAAGHVPDPEHPGQQMVVPRWAITASLEPAGALLCCSARDLTTFGQLHLDGGVAADGTRVLDADAVAQMQVTQVELPGGNSLGAVGWGLGWFIKDWNGAKVVGHNGDTYGQHAFLAVLPESGLSMALLTNGQGGHQLFDDLAARYLPEIVGVTPPTRPAPCDPSTVDIDPMLGTFSQPHASLEITRGDGGGVKLVQRTTVGEAREATIPTEVVDGSTLLVDAGAKLTVGFFGRDESGRYEWLHFGARVLHRTA